MNLPLTHWSVKVTVFLEWHMFVCPAMSAQSYEKDLGFFVFNGFIFTLCTQTSMMHSFTLPEQMSSPWNMTCRCINERLLNTHMFSPSCLNFDPLISQAHINRSTQYPRHVAKQRWNFQQQVSFFLGWPYFQRLCSTEVGRNCATSYL